MNHIGREGVMRLWLATLKTLCQFAWTVKHAVAALLAANDRDSGVFITQSWAVREDISDGSAEIKEQTKMIPEIAVEVATLGVNMQAVRETLNIIEHDISAMKLRIDRFFPARGDVRGHKTASFPYAGDARHANPSSDARPPIKEANAATVCAR